MVKKKKIFPKLKKKLKGFLTDESGKISKKDALGLAAGAVLLSGVEMVGAHNNITHNSGNFPTAPDIAGHANAGLTNANDNEGTKTGYGPYYGKVCNHASGIVNGHYSSTPSVIGLYRESQTGHGSHSNHSNGGWC